MFELVERQPSHFSNPDVLNLTPGEAMQGGRAKGGFVQLVLGNLCGLHSDFWCVPVQLGAFGSIHLVLWLSASGSQIPWSWSCLRMIFHDESEW